MLKRLIRTVSWLSENVDVAVSVQRVGARSSSSGNCILEFLRNPIP